MSVDTGFEILVQIPLVIATLPFMTIFGELNGFKKQTLPKIKTSFRT